jgi:CheY-like chemotaxis protein
MTLQSEPGVGTSVSLMLPMPAVTHTEASNLRDVEQALFRAEAETAVTMPASETTAPTTSSARSNDASLASSTHTSAALRVLYVEDNRINALLFEEALRPFEQLVLDVAEDGQMALAMARDCLPHVLVLDAHLPGMSGFEVLAALRQVPGMADTPAYMCSADAMPDDIAKAKAAGFAGYWTKPIDIVAVTDELCRLAERLHP